MILKTAIVWRVLAEEKHFHIKAIYTKKYVLIYLADEEIYPNTSIWLLYDLGESVTVSSLQIDLPYHLGEFITSLPYSIKNGYVIVEI